MVSPIHSGAHGINRTLPGPVHRFQIVKNDKTAVNTSLANVYCSAKIEIAQIHSYLILKKCLKLWVVTSHSNYVYFNTAHGGLYSRLKSVTSIKVKIGAHRHSLPPFCLATLLSNAMRNTDNNKDKIKITVIRVILALIYIQYDKLFRNHVFVMSTD